MTNVRTCVYMYVYECESAYLKNVRARACARSVIRGLYHSVPFKESTRAAAKIVPNLT